MEPICFIVYHTDVSPQGIETIGGIYPEEENVKWKERWRKFQVEYLPYARAYIETLFQSARLFHPKCRCIVLTDEDTPFSFSNEIEIKRFPLNPDKPAYNRLLAQKKYLTGSDDSHHTIFLDYDMLIQKSLSEIATFDFDVALTYDATIERVNGSFIMVKKGSLAHGIRYLQWVEEIYLNSYPGFEAWGGIAVSMNDIFVLNLKEITYLKTLKIKELKFLILPSDPYNYPITEKQLSFFEYLPDKKILHFKGPKKTSMLEYWNSYLKPML